MIHDEGRKIYTDPRFWIVLFSSAILLTYLIMSYPR